MCSTLSLALVLVAPKKAWNDLDLPCDSRDRDLFAASTVVSIGDGKTAQFWSSLWTNGRTLKSMAPTLFKKAKKISVHKAMQQNRWLTHIMPLSNEIKI